MAIVSVSWFILDQLWQNFFFTSLPMIPGWPRIRHRAHDQQDDSVWFLSVKNIRKMSGVVKENIEVLTNRHLLPFSQDIFWRFQRLLCTEYARSNVEILRASIRFYTFRRWPKILSFFLLHLFLFLILIGWNKNQSFNAITFRKNDDVFFRSNIGWQIWQIIIHLNGREAYRIFGKWK